MDTSEFSVPLHQEREVRVHDVCHKPEQFCEGTFLTKTITTIGSKKGVGFQTLMSIIAAESHYNWRVQIGHHSRASNWAHGCALLWDKTGYGCMVHPRIVLTSLSVWQEAQASQHGYEAMVRVGDDDPKEDPDLNEKGESGYKCQLGYADKERDLAALILDKRFLDRSGKKVTRFPPIAPARPKPGQALAVLTEQHLHGARRGGSYICFTYGYTCLLRGEDEVLFALTGIMPGQTYVGAAVFDERGKIYGVVTDYLSPNVDPRAKELATYIVVFSPVYKCASQILRLPPAEATKLSTPK